MNEQLIAELMTEMSKTKSKRMYVRYQTVLLTFQGKTAEEIVCLTGVSTATVARYRRDYKRTGIQGLNPKISTGRPKNLTDEQEVKLMDMIVTQTPEDLGFPAMMNWTCALVNALVKKTFEVEMSVNGVCKMLNRLKLSYTRPTYSLANADKEKQEIFKKNSSGSGWSVETERD